MYVNYPFDSAYSNIRLKDIFQVHQVKNSSNFSLNLYIFMSKVAIENSSYY